jgi:hypothetical protein
MVMALNEGYVIRPETGKGPYPVGEKIAKPIGGGKSIWGVVLGVKQIDERWLFDLIFDDGTMDYAVSADVVRRMLAEAAER